MTLLPIPNSVAISEKHCNSKCGAPRFRVRRRGPIPPDFDGVPRPGRRRHQPRLVGAADGGGAARRPPLLAARRERDREREAGATRRGNFYSKPAT